MTEAMLSTFLSIEMIKSDLIGFSFADHFKATFIYACVYYLNWSFTHDTNND